MKKWNDFLLSFFLFLNFNILDGKAVSISVLATEEILMDQSKSEDEVREILDWMGEKEEIEAGIFKRALNNIFVEDFGEFERRMFILRELLLRDLFQGRSYPKLNEVYQYLFKFALKNKDFEFAQCLFFTFSGKNEEFSAIDYAVFQGNFDFINYMLNHSSSYLRKNELYLNLFFSKSYAWAVRMGQAKVEESLLKGIFLEEYYSLNLKDLYLPPLIVADLILNHPECHSRLFKDGSLFEHWKGPFRVYQMMKNAMQEDFESKNFLDEFKKIEKDNQSSSSVPKNFLTLIFPVDQNTLSSPMEKFYALLESDFFSLRRNLNSQELKEKFIKLKKFCLLLKDDEKAKEHFNQFQDFYQRLMRKGLRLLVSQSSFKSKDEKNTVKEILIHLVGADREKNKLFKILQEKKDFEAMNSKFYLEKFSEVKLKDQYKNLGFEEVTKKEGEIFKVWETVEVRENNDIHYVEDLISSINNEELRGNLLENFSSVEEYQKILLKPLELKLKSNLDIQEIDFILGKLIEVNFKAMSKFLENFLMDVRVPEEQVIKILNILKERNAFNTYRLILEAVLERNFFYEIDFRENKSLVRALTVIRESSKYEALLENKEIFIQLKNFLDFNVSRSELVKISLIKSAMKMEDKDIPLLRILITMNAGQEFLNDFPRYFSDWISFFHFAIDKHYLKAFKLLLKSHKNSSHPCGILYTCGETGELSIVDYAAFQGALEELKLMWDHFSSDPEARKSLFQNALKWAIQGNRLEVIQYLLNQGEIVGFSKIDFSKINKNTIAFLILKSREYSDSNKKENLLMSSYLSQEWKDAERIFSFIEKIGNKIGKTQIELNQNADHDLEKYCIKVDSEGKKEIQNLIEELKKIQLFHDWDLMKEKIYTLFKVTCIIEKLKNEGKNTVQARQIIDALNNFYIVFAWMERSEKQENEGADEARKKATHLKEELKCFTDLYSIWTKLIAFHLRLFLTQKDFSSSDGDLEKAEDILFNFGEYDSLTPLEECDSFHKIHPEYLKENKFGLGGLFRLMKDNILERIMKNSNLSLNELFSVKIEFQDLIENETLSCLENYRDKIYSNIKNEDLKNWLQELEKDKMKREILESLKKRKIKFLVQKTREHIRESLIQKGSPYYNFLSNFPKR